MAGAVVAVIVVSLSARAHIVTGAGSGRPTAGLPLTYQRRERPVAHHASGMSPGGVRSARSARGDGGRAVTRAGRRADPCRARRVARTRQSGRLVRPVDRRAVARSSRRQGRGQHAGPALGAAQGPPVGRGGRPAGHPAAGLHAAGGAWGTGRVAVQAAGRGRGRSAGGGRSCHGGAAPRSGPGPVARARAGRLRHGAFGPRGGGAAGGGAPGRARVARPRRCWPAAGTGTSSRSWRH